MDIQAIDNHQLSIDAGKYWSLPFRVKNTEDLILFDISVHQTRAQLDDIRVYVMDDNNFRTWEHNLQARRAGARVGALPTVDMHVSTSLNWGSLSFRPTNLGNFHLVLDNTHSNITSKDIELSIYKIPAENPDKRIVREITERQQWKEAWNSFTKAELDLSEGKGASCCDNLRRGLINLLVRVCEALSGQPITLDPGKATDIGELKTRLSSYTPAYTIAPITQAWSLASELAKTERRGGQEPPLAHVLYAHRLVYAAAAFLVSIRAELRPPR